MNKIFQIAVLLVVSTVSMLASTQCILHGRVTIHSESISPSCADSIPIIQVLRGNGEVLDSIKVNYNPDSLSYAVSLFGAEGFSDSDVVRFRFIYPCDTIMAHTSGDAPIFIGYTAPNPPVPRRVNLAMNRAPLDFHLVSPVKPDTVPYIPNHQLAFHWHPAVDPDSGDVVHYQLVMVSLYLDTIRVNTTDTTASVTISVLHAYNAYAWTVFASDGYVTTAARDTFYFFTTPLEDVKELPGIPTSYSLKQNYPNPFNPSTVIQFSLKEMGFVSLKIYDVYGREVSSLMNGTLAPGEYQAVWNANNVAAGVYYYRLSAGNFTETKRMMLLK